MLGLIGVLDWLLVSCGRHLLVDLSAQLLTHHVHHGVATLRSRHIHLRLLDHLRLENVDVVWIVHLVNDDGLLRLANST